MESQKDRKDRREPPPPPPELDLPLPTDPDGIDQFNSTMSGIFNGVSLMKCQHCGRTMRWVAGLGADKGGGWVVTNEVAGWGGPAMRAHRRSVCRRPALQNELDELAEAEAGGRCRMNLQKQKGAAE